MLKKLHIFFMLFLAQFSWGQKDSVDYHKKLDSIYKNTVPRITSEQLSENLNSKSDLLVLDARELEEYQVSHIPDAKYAGYNQFDIKSCEAIDKDTPIVVYCSIGYRSERIGEKLLEAGFTNVRNLYGGIFEWANTEHIVNDTENKPTIKVHTYNKQWSKWLFKGEKVYGKQ
jgi:rhodanese-related sulfurtransferase